MSADDFIASVDQWNNALIKAAITMKGTTLKQLSLDNGAPLCCCSQTLRQSWPKGEKIISDFLGVPVHRLWPNRYPNVSTKKETSRIHRQKASQKSQKVNEEARA